MLLSVPLLCSESFTRHTRSGTSLCVPSQASRLPTLGGNVCYQPCTSSSRASIAFQILPRRPARATSDDTAGIALYRSESPRKWILNTQLGQAAADHSASNDFSPDSGGTINNVLLKYVPPYPSTNRTVDMECYRLITRRGSRGDHDRCLQIHGYMPRDEGAVM